eukprot:sb/3476179/
MRIWSGQCSDSSIISTLLVLYYTFRPLLILIKYNLTLRKLNCWRGDSTNILRQLDEETITPRSVWRRRPENQNGFRRRKIDEGRVIEVELASKSYFVWSNTATNLVDLPSMRVVTAVFI